MLSDEFLAALSDRAAEAEELRRLPAATVADFRAGGLAHLLLPARYGGQQADFPEILDAVRRMAHGCASTAWTLGFYMLHNWMLALYDEQAQEEVFVDGPVLCPAPLAPTGRGVPADGGVRLTGRWSWATGIMDADWVMVGALCGPDDGIYPALALLPAGDVEVDDVWHTAGMRATGSNDVIVSDVFVPEHRLVNVVDIYGGTAPGAALPRRPAVPLADGACVGAAGGHARPRCGRTRRRPVRRPAGRPSAGVFRCGTEESAVGADQARRCAGAAGRTARSAGRHHRRHRDVVGAGERVSRPDRANARAAAAHIVHESRSVIADLLESSGASAQFLTNPMQRAKRDVDVICGHVVFDYDTSRELAGACEIGVKVSPIAMF